MTRIAHLTDAAPGGDALKWALRFAAAGFGVLPLHSVRNGSCTCGRAVEDKDRGHKAGKHPRTPNGLKDASTDADQVRAWAELWGAESVNWGAVIGSGALVLDAESSEVADALEEVAGRAGLVVRTGRGCHLWYANPGWGNVSPRRVLTGPVGFDVRIAASYVLLPGSMHASGRYYVAERGTPDALGDEPDPALRQVLTKELQAGGRAGRWKAYAEYVTTAPVGPDSGRNTWFTGLCGHLAGCLQADDELRPLYDAGVRLSAEALHPTDWDEGEWGGIADRIWEAEAAKPPTGNASGGRAASAATAAARFLDAEYELVSAQGENQIFAVKGSLAVPHTSKALQAQVARAVFLATGDVPSAEAVSQALSTAWGGRDLPELPIWNRVGKTAEGRRVLDLGKDKEGPTDAPRFVVVGPDGWHLTEDPGCVFVRTEGQRPLPTPVNDGTGSLEVVREHFAVDEEHYRLLIGWWLAALLADCNVPVLGVSGGPGTAKTATSRRAAQTLDPRVAQTTSLPRSDRDWVPSVRASWVTVFDNVSHLFPWQSDAMCRTVTRDGLRERQLYQNLEHVEVEIRRVLVMNGLAPSGVRGDLTDRLISLTLRPIPSERRITDAALDRAWEAAHPALLAGLLDLLVRVLTVLPDVHLDEYPRMADFARLLAALDRATGWTTLKTYLGARVDALTEVLATDPIAQALLVGRPDQFETRWGHLPGKLASSSRRYR